MHVVINGWFLNQLTTGSGQYLHHLLDYLSCAPDRAHLSLVAPVVKPARQIRALQARWPSVDMMTGMQLPLPAKIGKLWWEQVTIPLAVRRLQADVLWVPYWAAPFWQPCPTVVTVHDLIHRLLPAYQGGRLQQLYTQLVSYTAQHATAVITVSHAGARDIIAELGIPGERVYVVYNGAEEGLVAGQDLTYLNAVREKYQLPERYFLYLGGFDLRKNVRTTLEAYRRYLDQGGDPAIRLVVAGRLPVTDTAFAPNPQKIAAELALTTQIQFCGWVDEVDKPALYALATAYLFPGLYEGFGLMLLEAMQAGAPVVTSAK
ncbi:MAG: glycosyltransferase family 1 protein [Caldilineaceae bacterium]